MPANTVGKPLLIEADPRVPPPDYSQAPCRDLEPKAADAQFHPDDIRSKDTLTAKALCRTCSQATQCLMYTLANPGLYPEGVWAATTPKERDELRAMLKQKHGSDWVAAVVRTPTRSSRRSPARRRSTTQSTLAEVA